jgi:hypothetical protein
MKDWQPTLILGAIPREVGFFVVWIGVWRYYQDAA